MKKTLIFMCAASIGASAQARDFSKEYEYGTDPGRQWYDWTTGQSAEGNVLWDLGGILPTADDNFTFKSENVKFYANGDDLVDGTVYAKNWNFTSNWEGAFNVRSGSVKLNVANDINIKIDQWNTGFSFSGDDNKQGFQNIKVGGNMSVDGVGITLQTVFVNRHNYGKDDLSMIVGGVLNFKDDRNNRWIVRNGDGTVDPNVDYVDAWVQLGGLNGQNLKVSTNDPGARSFNLVFKSDGKTPFTGGEWSGAFTSYWNGGKAASITMDGGADGGLQTIRLIDSALGENDAAMTSQTLSMLSGKLALGTESVTKFTEATVSGGTLLIVDSSKTNDKQGSFATDILNLDGGEIIFDASKGGSDFITVGVINGAGASLVVDLDPAEFHLGDSVDGVSLSLFRGATAADWDALSNAVKFMLDGVEVTVGGHSFSSGTLNLSGVIAAVPEPASVAAFLGVAALALAAFRRGKC